MKEFALLCLLMLSFSVHSQTVYENTGTYEKGLESQKIHEGKMSWVFTPNAVSWIVTDRENNFLLTKSYVVDTIYVSGEKYKYVVTDIEDNTKMVMVLESVGGMWVVKHEYDQSYVTYIGATDVTKYD